MQEKLTDITIEEFRADMEDLRKTNQAQADYAKRTWIMSLVSTIAVVIAVVFIIGLGVSYLPRVNKILDDVQVSLTNVNKITTELSQTDFDSMISDVGKLVDSTQKGVTSAVNKLESVDIEQLNQAIQDLTDVIDPLANFFNKFKYF